jgi:hypothetical protein
MWRRWLLPGLLPALLLASGCQATGMGWIPSTDGVDKATFGFVFDSTTTSTTTSTTLSGSYHDPQGATTSGVVDVAFKGTGVVRPCKAGDPACTRAPANAKGGCLTGEPSYTSQNPKIPGGGMFFLLVCDLDGTGGAGLDFIFIQVDSGPYMGYTNLGDPQGNITVKDGGSPQ